MQFLNPLTDRAQLSAEELAQQERREMYIQDQRGMLQKAKLDARLERNREVARNMYARGMDAPTIATMLELELVQVLKLLA